jgi:hypothetical protein
LVTVPVSVTAPRAGTYDGFNELISTCSG